MSTLTVAIQPDLVYGKRDGTDLTFDQYMPSTPNGASIVFVNSGGFVSGKLIQYAEDTPSSYRFLQPDELTLEQGDPIPLLAQFSFARLLDAGFAVFDIRHSNAPHTVDDMLDDVRAAIVHIHNNCHADSLDPNRMGIFGASSGGHLALAAGLTTNTDSGQRAITTMAAFYPAGFDFLADISAFPQIRDGLPALAVSDAALDAISIKSLYQSGGAPTLVVYGDNDFPFILNPCHSICSEFPKAGIETKCIVIEGAAHEFMREDGYHPDDGDRAQTALVAWFQRQLPS